MRRSILAGAGQGFFGGLRQGLQSAQEHFQAKSRQGERWKLEREIQARQQEFQEQHQQRGFQQERNIEEFRQEKEAERQSRQHAHEASTQQVGLAARAEAQDKEFAHLRQMQATDAVNHLGSMIKKAELDLQNAKETEKASHNYLLSRLKTELSAAQKRVETQEQGAMTRQESAQTFEAGQAKSAREFERFKFTEGLSFEKIKQAESLMLEYDKIDAELGLLTKRLDATASESQKDRDAQALSDDKKIAAEKWKTLETIKSQLEQLGIKVDTDKTIAGMDIAGRKDVQALANQGQANVAQIRAESSKALAELKAATEERIANMQINGSMERLRAEQAFTGEENRKARELNEALTYARITSTENIEEGRRQALLQELRENIDFKYKQLEQSGKISREQIAVEKENANLRAGVTLAQIKAQQEEVTLVPDYRDGKVVMVKIDRSGKERGIAINPETGAPIESKEGISEVRKFLAETTIMQIRGNIEYLERQGPFISEQEKEFLRDKNRSLTQDLFTLLGYTPPNSGEGSDLTSKNKNLQVPEGAQAQASPSSPPSTFRESLNALGNDFMTPPYVQSIIRAAQSIADGIGSDVWAKIKDPVTRWFSSASDTEQKTPIYDYASPPPKSLIPKITQPGPLGIDRPRANTP